MGARRGFQSTRLRQSGDRSERALRWGHGFSEGAALAAALLLEDAAGVGPLVEPMFGFAVFFNAVNVLLPSKELGRRMFEIEERDSRKSFEEGNIDHGSPALDCAYALCSSYRG